MTRVTYSDQDKEDSNFFMAVFQYLYASSNVTLLTITKDLGISTNALTLMKNGQKIISFSVFEDLYFYFTQQKFKFDDSITEELYALFIKMIRHHIAIEVEEMEDCIHQILDHRDRYEHSFGFFLYHLTELFWEFWRYFDDSPTRLAEQAAFQSTREICQYGENTFNPLCYSFYLDVCGLQNASQGEIAVSMDYFERALEAADNKEIAGLRQCILYHIARISDKTGRALEGYLTCQNLSSYYAQHYNPVRQIYIENVMVYLLTEMGQFHEAHAHAVALLQAAPSLTDEDIQTFVSSTLIWNAICAGWYEIALEYMNQPNVRKKLSTPVLGFEPLCLARLGRLEEARKSLLAWKYKNKAKKIEYLHLMVQDLVDKRKRMFLRSNTAFAVYCNKYGYHQSERLAYILRLEVTREYDMEADYLEALKAYLSWEHPKPELPVPEENTSLPFSRLCKNARL